MFLGACLGPKLEEKSFFSYLIFWLIPIRFLAPTVCRQDRTYKIDGGDFILCNYFEHWKTNFNLCPTISALNAKRIFYVVVLYFPHTVFGCFFDPVSQLHKFKLQSIPLFLLLLFCFLWFADKRHKHIWFECSLMFEMQFNLRCATSCFYAE